MHTHTSFAKTARCLAAAVAALVLLCLFCACDTSTASPTAPDSPAAPRVEPLASTDKDDFSVSKAFSSNMVLQRDEPIRVWGFAGADRNGDTVRGEFMGVTAEATVADGEWLLTFRSDRESGGFAASTQGSTMRITCGSDKTVFEDVLIGDVYMVIGQSNVAYGMNAHCANHGLSISSFVKTGTPIRLKYNTLNDTAGYPARGTTEVCEDVVNGRTWWVPTTQNVQQFSALGYLFALELVEKTDGEIPIGIIEIDGNGQPLGAFMPNEVAGEVNSDSYNAGSGMYVPPGVNGTHARYMYNHYMYPYEKYALAGVVWYQGESDYQTETANTFPEKFTALMTYMRSTHNLNNKDFPVYIMEIPTIYRQPADHTGAWHFLDLGYIRAEMGSIPGYLPNSYLSVSSDLFTDDRYDNSLHPDIKAPQAARMADIAGSVWYGLTALDKATGPILSSYEVSEDRRTVTLTFTNVGDGLATSDGGKAVKGFLTFNKVGAVLTDAAVEATITSANTVTVTASSDIYGVLYNSVCDNFYGKTVNLCNSHGQPASAFTFSEQRRYQIRRELVGENGRTETPAASDTLAVHFATTAPTVAIGTQLLTAGSADAWRGGSVTVSLYVFDTDYAITVANKPKYTETLKGFDRCEWIEIEVSRNRTISTGDYLLVISGISDAAFLMGDAHEGQVVYRNGEAVENTSLLLGLTYANEVDSLYDIPNDPNNPEPETLPETQPETLPETHPETVPTVDSETAPETVAATETIAETLGQTETSETAPSATETTGEDDGGCSSAVALFGVVLLPLSVGVCLLRRREDGIR